MAGRPPILEHPYPTPYGRAAEFRLPAEDGREPRHVRLEPREACVVVGWTVAASFDDTASRLGEAASDESDVVVAHSEDAHRVDERGGHLAALLRNLSDVELVRIERGSDTVIWERRRHSTSGGELCVIADGWSEAGQLAAILGALDVAEALPSLVGHL